MRTPGEEVFHAAGLCLGEGIIDRVDDFVTMGYDENMDPNLLDVWLTAERLEKVKMLLERRSYISQTSCGICGKKMMEDLQQVLTPLVNDSRVEMDEVFNFINKLSRAQSYYPRTRGSHAALLLDHSLATLSFAEDVGRHNALDKALGKALMDSSLDRALAVVLSSRISYELVQKSARAGIAIMISKSRPTALAVRMGQSLNMTLACFFGPSELTVFCGQDRILTG